MTSVARLGNPHGIFTFGGDMSRGSDGFRLTHFASLGDNGSLRGN